MHREAYDSFDPDNVTGKTMEDIHDSISSYLELLEKIMVIPEDMEEKHGDRIRDSIKVTKDLLKRLKKKDPSVFVSD